MSTGIFCNFYILKVIVQKQKNKKLLWSSVIAI